MLASWDLDAGNADLYVNDVSDRMLTTLTAGSICYIANQWGISGIGNGTLDADVADVYVEQGVYLDLSVVANRRKFRTAAGKPVDLGPMCTGPTGIRPIKCFTGAVAAWGTNKGYGGGFTTQGDGLTNAPTSPSD